MKLVPMTAVVALFTATCLTAQSSPSPPRSPSASPSLAVVAALSKKLNAKKLKVGDRVNARVLQDVVVQGNVVIPRDSIVIGRVTDVAAATKTDPRSRLALLFESRLAKGRGTLPMHGVIQALAPPLPDPSLETALSSSSPYDAAANGHPVNGELMSTQPNAPTEVVNRDRPRESGVRALEQRERALEGANQPEASGTGPQGALTVRSRGVFGLPGLSLSQGTAVPAIVATGQNVELKSGTQIVLRLDGSLP